MNTNFVYIQNYFLLVLAVIYFFLINVEKHCIQIKCMLQTITKLHLFVHLFTCFYEFNLNTKLHLLVILSQINFSFIYIPKINELNNLLNEQLEQNDQEIQSHSNQ